MTLDTERVDCVVVGAGLAGMSAAHRLATAGLSVVVAEASDRTGGRAATTWVDGAPVDRGFQSLFAAYPETRDFLRAIGMGREDFAPFSRGGVFHDGDTWSRLAMSPGGLWHFSGLRRGDIARLGRLVAEVAGRSPAALLAGQEKTMTTAEYLSRRGFSATAVDGFFRPLFGVITLDRGLGADAAYFRFLLSMLARGPAVAPVDGHGMITERATEDLRRRGGEVRTGSRVAAVLTDESGARATGVRLVGGGEIVARSVVLAVAAPAAIELLRPLDPDAAAHVPTAPAGSATLAYLLDRPLYRGRTIVLNSAPDGGDPRIDLVCQATNTIRPEGGVPHVLFAMSITTGTDDEPDADALAAATEALAERWVPGFDLRRNGRLVEVILHPFAQFRVTPGVRTRLPGARTRVAGLVVAGDLTAHPSIEGAVSSGRVAAEVVAEQLTVTP
jgi:phytoene dehydrogenase-like protein